MRKIGSNGVLACACCVLLSAGGVLVGCDSGGTKYVTVRLPEGFEAQEAERLQDAVTLSRKGYEAENAGKNDRALKLYREAVAIYPQFAPAWNNAGVLLLEQDRYLEAAEAFRTASQLTPDEPRPLYNLALCFDRRGYFEDARGFYRSSLERDPNYLPSLRGLARTEFRLNRADEESLDIIKRALLLEQDSDWVFWLRSRRLALEKQLEIG